MRKFRSVLLPAWQQQDALKHRYTSTSPYGIKFQKTVVFIVTEIKFLRVIVKDVPSS
jgi:hypothetical protein